MLDTILVNTPVSSPLHPQLNLPLLKGYLTQNGYKAKVIDSNILFFHHFLGIKGLEMNLNEFFEHPLKLLQVYNDLERQLWEKSKAYDGLHVGLRTLAMKYDRIYFDTVIQAVSDENANPFISFYDNLIESDMRAQNPKIVGIGITFQDQIIPAFTLASRLRIRLPDVKIVFGGQMITRCYDDMLKHEGLCKYFDFLTLWDGEMPLVDIHRKVIRGEEVEFVNAFDVRAGTGRADRLSKAPSSQEVPSPDYTDLPLDAYFVPEYLIPFQTTRGCYAKCAFCAIPFGSNKYRMREVDRIIEDLIDIQEYTEKKYGKKATYFKFMEDTSSPSILKGISVEIEKRGLDIKWETFARLEKMFSEDGFMEQLYRGGCRKIHWGLESNDPAILSRMNKKNTMSCSDVVLEKSGKAGVLNFCFLLAGFPGESDEARTNLVNYVISNPHIHTLTMTTFDLTRNSPMEQDFTPKNIYKLDCEKAKDFQVRLPYTVGGQNWKAAIIPKAHQMMIDIIKGRPDIGFMTLFPDQVRSLLCDHFGNEWGRIFVKKYGEENVKAMLLSTENYAKGYSTNTIIDPAQLPEPLRREHYRTKEDLAMIARAVNLRRDYEERRFNQV